MGELVKELMGAGATLAVAGALYLRLTKTIDRLVDVVADVTKNVAAIEATLLEREKRII